MNSCVICGAEGGAPVRFVVAQKDGQDKIPIGLGQCSICFSCIRKKRHVSDYAIFILGFFLTASMLLLLLLAGGVEVFTTIPVSVLIMTFLPCVALFLLGRYEYKKVNRESNEKNLTEKAQAAAQKLAIQYFKKLQSVPAECVLLNFEPLAASGKFGNYLLEWHDAQSDLARLLLAKTLLEKGTRQAIQPGDSKLAFIPPTDSSIQNAFSSPEAAEMIKTLFFLSSADAVPR